MIDDPNAPTSPDAEAPLSAGGKPRSPDERYSLRYMLGHGGMGEVWLAHDVRVDRDIAIKLVRRTGDMGAVARFLREARVQGRLEHPSVVPVHDLGSDPDCPYIAMKRLAGTTLAAVLASGDPQWTRRTLLARFVEVCLAAEFAHQRGVIHRDLKPANIMLGDFGETYVLDWGLARIVEPDLELAANGKLDAIHTADLRSDISTDGHTEAGAILGTPGYMAPEQMRGELVDRRTDVYSLGCILFEILAGAPAIPRDQAFELTLNADCLRPSARHQDAEIAPELDDACATATAAEPSRRLPTARALADKVQHFLDGDRDLQRRRDLASEHAAHAAAIFSERGDDARVEAMRTSGRAIALDPTNRTAQELLARLLLERPKTIPPDAQREIERQRERVARNVLRSALVAYGPFLLILVTIKLIGAPGIWPFASLGTLLVAQIAMCLVAARSPLPIPNAVYLLLTFGQLGLLCLLGVIVGPLLLLPIILTGSLPVFMMMPTLRIPKTVVTLHVLAIAIPLLLEYLDIVPATFRFSADALELAPWAIHLSPHTMVVLILATVAVQMGANSIVFARQRVAQEHAQELVHVQTWQLAQLITTDENP